MTEAIDEPKKFFLRKKHQQAPILHDFAKLLGRQRDSKPTKNNKDAPAAAAAAAAAGNLINDSNKT